MYTLVTYTDRRIHGLDIWITIWDEAEEAEETGAYWLETYPDDIVMLVEVQKATCRHCGKPIQENPGWIVHRWVHVGHRNYTCLNKELTQAEPEDTA